MSFESPLSNSPSQDDASDLLAASSSHSCATSANGSTEHLVEQTPSPSFISLSQQKSPSQSQNTSESKLQMSCVLDGTSTPDVDEQILEALKSKDRLFVLRLGELMESLIKEQHSRTRFTVNPDTSYQRLLVHRCAQYYKLSPENEPISRGISVCIAIDSRIPLRRISELVPAEQSSHPTFKIMRRSEKEHDRRRQKSSISQPASVAGEDELSDPEPSETGSMGSRSTTSKKHKTIAEREAAYQEARSRIFKDLEEKEKSKERDNSASSSTLSLVSGSGSASGGGRGSSVVGDIDDASSSAATESEWSSPITDRRRRADIGDPSLTFRSNSAPYNISGTNQSSGASSPSFTFPSLHDFTVNPPAFDPPQPYVPPPTGYVAPYPGYGYPAPGPPPTNLYIQPYHYYSPYPFPPPPHIPHQSSSDPASPVSGPADGYPQHPPPPNSVSFASPFSWPPPPPPPAVPGQHHSYGEDPNHHAQRGHHPPNPQLSFQPPFPMYAPGPYGHYAVPSPYPPLLPPPSHSQGPPHMNPQSPYSVETSFTNGKSPDSSVNGNGNHSPTFSRNSEPYGHFGGNTRLGGAPPARSAWSYGPGVGPSGAAIAGPHSGAVNPGIQFGQSNGISVGPRLGQPVRRISGASSGSSGARTPADETASIASSSTSSSSSRRTYTSTVPKHPLPARPDWAAGLKAQPTLHAPRNRNHDSTNSSRNMSPARTPNHQSQSLPPQHDSSSQSLTPILLRPTDFPPLSMSSSNNDKRPSVAGVWGNSSSTRTILAPNPVHTNHAQSNAYGNALFNHTGGNMANNGNNHGQGNGGRNRLDDNDRDFQRPPRKHNVELFNPKGAGKRVGASPQGKSPSPTNSDAPDKDHADKEKEKARGDAVASAILIDKLASVKLQVQENESVRSPPRDQGAVLTSSQPIIGDTSAVAAMSTEQGTFNGEDVEGTVVPPLAQ